MIINARQCNAEINFQLTLEKYAIHASFKSSRTLIC